MTTDDTNRVKTVVDLRAAYEVIGQAISLVTVSGQPAHDQRAYALVHAAQSLLNGSGWRLLDLVKAGVTTDSLEPVS